MKPRSRAEVLRVVAAQTSTQRKGPAMQLSEVAKTVVNVCTLIVAVGSPVASLVDSGSYPPAVGMTVGIAVAVAGALIHYFTPNTTTDPRVAATQSVRLKGPKHAAVQ